VGSSELLFAQRLHRVDFGGSRGREPHREQHHSGKDERRRDKRRRIPRLDTKQEAGNETREAQGRGEAEDHSGDGQPHAMPDDELANGSAIRSQGHADAHFLLALRDGVRHDAVDADSGQSQRDEAEDAKQQHVEALTRS
jgi:hypothetical protein